MRFFYNFFFTKNSVITKFVLYTVLFFVVDTVSVNLANKHFFGFNYSLSLEVPNLTQNPEKYSMMIPITNIGLTIAVSNFFARFLIYFNLCFGHKESLKIRSKHYPKIIQNIVIFLHYFALSTTFFDMITVCYLYKINISMTPLFIMKFFYIELFIVILTTVFFFIYDLK